MINDEVIAALATVRAAMAGSYRLPQEVRDALNTLDNADVFAEIDEESYCDVADKPLPEPPCGLERPCVVHGRR